MDRPLTWLARFRKSGAKRDPRHSALLWITALCLMFGALEAGAPLENMVRNARDTIRQHDASGKIVIVGIDERTVGALQEWPLHRRHYAALIDRLNRRGVRRIFLDLSFTTRSTIADDRMLADAIARSRSEVVLPGWFDIDPVTQRRTDILPVAVLRPHASIANINVRFDHDSVVRRLPYAMQIAGATYPSFAAKIAGRAGGTGETFPLDYAIRIGSMPVVSAIDILEDKDAPGRLAGRDVVIGATSAQLDNVYFAPTVGLISGVFLHALGAETLLTGKPHTLSWIVPFLAVWLSIVALMVPRSRVMAITGYALMSVAVLLVPLMLDAHQILVDIVPTMLLLILIGGWTSWSGLRLAYRQRAIVNVVSGLPNLNALRAVAHVADVVLIAARVRNFPEITASLPADHERALVEQIARRLALGSGGATIYQGDEGIFAWLAPTQSVAQTADYFDAMQALFRNALTVGERRVDVAITFGLAADVGQSPFNRLGGALMAADAAAEAGLHWTLHEPVEASDSSWKLGLLTHLDAAIDGGEIWVAYQPKIDLRSDRIVGCEALVRWTHPEKGPISPADFIPVAEQQNRIDKLTYHVLDTAIHTAATINGHGMPFSVAVNLSVRVLEDPELLDRIAGLLARYALAPNLLTLEITETAALSGSRRSIEVLEALRATGVGLSIDDYGTGFSNLENLRTIPASEIKIDRSFVDAIEHSRADAVMVRSTIHMAHSLGQAVVAEGVERAETLAMLRQMGCDQVQGYLTGRPMKFAALSRCLILDRRKAAA